MFVGSLKDCAGVGLLIYKWNLLFIKNRQICLASNWILKRAKRKAHICQKIVVWSSRLTCQSARSISIRYQQQQLRHFEQNWLNFAILKRSGCFWQVCQFSRILWQGDLPLAKGWTGSPISITIYNILCVLQFPTFCIYAERPTHN